MTATHQLVAAVHTLGLCTRPLLLAGFPAAAAEAGAPPLAAEELGAQPAEQARVLADLLGRRLICSKADIR